MFKVGQRVFAFAHGWGTIIKDEGTSAFPIVVEIENSKEKASFTVDGKELVGATRPTLFFKKIAIPPDALEPPWEPDFQPGDVVEIKSRESGSLWYGSIYSDAKKYVITMGSSGSTGLLGASWDKSIYIFRKVGHV